VTAAASVEARVNRRPVPDPFPRVTPPDLRQTAASLAISAANVIAPPRCRSVVEAGSGE
jgi:hypothetical protein